LTTFSVGLGVSLGVEVTGAGVATVVVQVFSYQIPFLLVQVVLPETLAVFEPVGIHTLKSLATHQPHPAFSAQEEQLVLEPHSVGAGVTVAGAGVTGAGVTVGGSVQESLTLAVHSPLPVHLKVVAPALVE
jgi:hypothetical protein